MPRLGITVTDEMQAALKRVAHKRSTPVANLARQIIIEFLEANGEEITTEVTWGGNRRDSDPDSDEVTESEESPELVLA